MSDSKKVVEELPCALTEEERSEKGVTLAGLHQQQIEVEEKKKTAMSDFNARIKKIGGDIHYLSMVVNSGKESRNVKCRLDYDWPAGTKTLVRLDTGEVVREEVISEFERQQYMDFVDRENSKSVKKAEGEEWPEEEGDAEPEGTEETEGEPGQEETGEAEDADPTKCTEFGDFSAEAPECSNCGDKEACYEATPQEPKDETITEEEQVEEGGEPEEKLPPRHKCHECEEFFEEPKDNEDEDDSTSCPLCGTKNWM